MYKQPVESTYSRLHSTPVSSCMSLDASKVRSDSGDPFRKKDGCSTMNRDHVFSFVLSNIGNRVTEHDIDVLVSQSLKMTKSDYVEVTKLVPRWKSCKKLDYISFKVVLDEKWKSSALNVSTWPRKIKIREFVSRLNHDTSWYPTE